MRRVAGQRAIRSVCGAELVSVYITRCHQESKGLGSGQITEFRPMAGWAVVSLMRFS